MSNLDKEIWRPVEVDFLTYQTNRVADCDFVENLWNWTHGNFVIVFKRTKRSVALGILVSVIGNTPAHGICTPPSRNNSSSITSLTNVSAVKNKKKQLSPAELLRQRGNRGPRRLVADIKEFKKSFTDRFIEMHRGGVNPYITITPYKASGPFLNRAPNLKLNFIQDEKPLDLNLKLKGGDFSKVDPSMTSVENKNALQSKRTKLVLRFLAISGLTLLVITNKSYFFKAYGQYGKVVYNLIKERILKKGHQIPAGTKTSESQSVQNTAYVETYVQNLITLKNSFKSIIAVIANNHAGENLSLNQIKTLTNSLAEITCSRPEDLSYYLTQFAEFYNPILNNLDHGILSKITAEGVISKDAILEEITLAMHQALLRAGLLDSACQAILSANLGQQMKKLLKSGFDIQGAFNENSNSGAGNEPL